MNIFVLDLQPMRAAQYHCDKHVVKMILESAQLLCTAHHEAGSATKIMYKPTHVNHPCAKWVRGNAARYRWLYALYVQLCDEYTYRYGKVHLTDTKLRRPLFRLPKTMRDDSHLQSYNVDGFALAMPDKYKDFDSAVRSYRAYYMGEKRDLAEWTKRGAPDWWE